MRYAVHFVDSGDGWLDADKRLFTVLLGMPTKGVARCRSTGWRMTKAVSLGMPRACWTSTHST